MVRYKLEIHDTVVGSGAHVTFHDSITSVKSKIKASAQDNGVTRCDVYEIVDNCADGGRIQRHIAGGDIRVGTLLTEDA